MPEEWRILLYPLGMLSTIAFSFRFIIQWLQSEKANRSIVTAPFWWLSILGNILLAVHTFIQGQYPVCIVQAINATIASRNLNLMEPSSKQWPLKTVLYLLGGSALITTLLFILTANGEWFRIPTHPFQSENLQLSYTWHLLGTLGVILFASRFWVQWIQAEFAHKSSLQAPFWWLSLLGAFFSILYFTATQDYINLVGPLFGLIPYCRNLILLYRE